MIDDHLSDALRLILDRMAHRPVVWAITGSLGHALQGLPLTPDDIDIQTDAAGAYAIGRIFADRTSIPVRFVVSERVRSHLGALALGSVSVEIMGEVEKRLPDGSWTYPPALIEHRQFVDAGGRTVPVLSLAYEARAYEILGRTARADLLRAYLR